MAFLETLEKLAKLFTLFQQWQYFYVAQICENKFANTNKTLEMRKSDRASIAKVIPLN